MLWLCIRLPALRHEALAASECEALERLAAWAYQWSSWVSYRLRGDESMAGEDRTAAQASLLWLELGASRALFGEPLALSARIDAELTQLGYSHYCALAPSPTGAALLTRVRERRCVLTSAQLRSRLASLPLSYLELPAETLQALHSAGLRCIEEVLALPAAALARRFGPQCCQYLARLTGAASDPRPAFRLPEIHRARCAFEYELHDITGLLFPLQRLLQELQGYLRARDCAVQHFMLELEHRHATSGATAARRVTSVRIGLAAPAREAARFMLLARERLQSLSLAAPVCALTLIADAFTAASSLQQDLFGSEAQQQGELGQLLDRLRARLGTEAVQAFHLHADHRPERAFTQLPPEQLPRRAQDPAAAGSANAGRRARPPRPAALLASPQRIEAPAMLLQGPERIESGWWDGEEIMRDYYVARGANGARQWVFRNLSEGGWYLQGWWV